MRNSGFFPASHVDRMKELSENGYCRFPMLSSSSIMELTQFYQEHFRTVDKGFYPSMFSRNSKLNRMVTEVIESCFTDALGSQISDDFEILYGNFMVKYPGEESFMKVHQDWTYVDETENESFAIWVPLIDTVPENGSIHVVPRSHLIPNFKRGPGMDNPFYPHSELLMSEQLSVSQNLAAGEALCWNHRLVHYSIPNRTSVQRVAVTAIYVPKDAQIIHYFKQDSGLNLNKYVVDRQFFHSYDVGSEPDRPILSVENYDPMRFGEAEMETYLKVCNPK